MQELLLVLVGLAVFAAIGVVTVVITPELMIQLGLWTLAIGLLLGIPTGFWYHVVL